MLTPPQISSVREKKHGIEFVSGTIPTTKPQIRVAPYFNHVERLKVTLLEKQTKQDSRERVEKPWGYELIWARTNAYVGKILFVRSNESLSLQYHNQKEETLYLESGECKILTGPSPDKLVEHVLLPGDVFHVTPKTLHQIVAVTDCRLFEVSTPQLTDVVRLKDRYGRS